MSTRHVILGLIKEHPSHTYEVVTRFDRRLKSWQVNRGQVYRTVSTLEREGLIEATGGSPESPKAGPSWHLTGRGERELARWFESLCEDVEPLRGEVLARLAVASPSEQPLLMSMLDWYERALVSQIQEDLGDRRATIARAGDDNWNRSIAGLVADGALLHHDAELQWVRRARELLTDLGATTDRHERQDAGSGPGLVAQG